MAEYKLTYFNGRGLAELSRWILSYANIPFTDERIEREDWPQRKKEFPGGKLPVLEVEGKQIPQSLAIARFLATKTGLVPEDPIKAAYCDALVESLRDSIVDMYRISIEEGKTEEEKKKKLTEEYLPKTLYPMLDCVENGLGKKEWLMADKITWGDIAVARCMDSFYGQIEGLEAKYPKTKALTDKIRNLPGIKEWIQKRPEE